jgi:hypothetical protein
MEIENVDHIEARHGDALKHNQTGMPKKLGLLHQISQFFGRIATVFLDLADEHTVQAPIGKNRPDDFDRPSVISPEGRIVKTDHVGKPAFPHGVVLGAPGGKVKMFPDTAP